MAKTVYFIESCDSDEGQVFWDYIPADSPDHAIDRWEALRGDYATVVTHKTADEWGDDLAEFLETAQAMLNPVRAEKAWQATLMGHRVQKVSPIPADHPVQPVWDDDNPVDPATCGYCELTWDDGKVTSMTPAPSGRCPFEAFHIYQREPA